MILGNGSGKVGWYEIKKALHCDVLIGSLVASGSATFVTWKTEVLVPAIHDGVAQLGSAIATTAFTFVCGVAATFVKNWWANNTGKKIPPKRPRRRGVSG